jgi:hypothetical protein
LKKRKKRREDHQINSGFRVDYDIYNYRLIRVIRLGSNIQLAKGNKLIRVNLSSSFSELINLIFEDEREMERNKIIGETLL